jgi:deoxyribose-phosphate aldolase
MSSTPPTTASGTPAAFDRGLASLIDHTLLKAEALPSEVDRLCAEAVHFGFASVCVNPSFVSRCRQSLGDSPVKVCTVIGFPLGATSTSSKVAEADQAIRDGAQELDMVIHIGMLKTGADDYVRNDIAAVVLSAHRQHAVVKVIIETALLTNDEKRRACQLAKQAGADFVKTSTGFSSGGATVEDIALMRNAVGQRLGIKASGGIRTREQAQAMVAAGATRIGASGNILAGESPSVSSTS